MEIALWGLFWILIAFAFIGCFINKGPGPILALAAVLIAKLCMKAGALIAWSNVIAVGVLVAASIIVIKQLPKWTSKLGTYGKGAKWGSIIGSIFGLIVACALISGVKSQIVELVLIVILCTLMTFIFAVGGEFISLKNFKSSLRNGSVATFEYACSTLIKLFAVFYSVYIMFNN